MSALPHAQAPIDLVLGRLECVKKTGGGFIARCPAHDDQKPSLSIKEADDGKVLLKCFTGCSVERVVEAIGLELHDLFVPNEPRLTVVTSGPQETDRIYSYLDEDGVILHETVRYRNPKDFRQRAPTETGGYVWTLKDVKRLVLYRLPELLAADPRDAVFVLEGEKDVDLAIERFGLVATTNPMGAGRWRPEFCEPLAGRNIIVVPDNDQPGCDHANQVVKMLTETGCVVRIVSLPDLPPKGDFSDWVAAGGTRARLEELSAAAPVWGAAAEKTAAWPVLDVAAYHGPAGDLVWALDPFTEADPVAVLMNVLAYIGNAVGRGPHVNIGEDRHACNLFIGMVGETSKGRKGTAGRGIDRLMTEVDQKWAEDRKQGGASSGEGILSAIRDATYMRNKKTGEEELDDPGIDDKRLLLEEEEFSFQLKAAQRQGNTITEIIRRGWDSRSTLRIMTKQSPLKASKPHITMIVHITKEELARNVAETEMANGFLNRYLWVLVRRSKFLPFPKRMDNLDFSQFVERFTAIKQWACGRDCPFEFDDEAAEIWGDAYQGLAEGAPGLAGAMTARAAPIVRRLSLIYAVLDMSPAIKAVHLEAALAVWDYAEQSVKQIFGDLTGDAVADRIMAVLRQSGPQTQSDLSDLFGRNVPSARLGHALEVLLNAGFIAMERIEPEGGKGRPRTIWSAIAKETKR